MNTVQPIRTKDKINAMKIQLKSMDDKYYIMFLVGINVGLRVSDILRIKVKDVADAEHVVIREQKTGKTKRFLINKKMQKEISDYISNNCLTEEDFLIPSKRVNGDGDYVIGREWAYRVLNRAGRMVGVSEVGTHTMRKTFGYWHYKQYHDIALLQEIFNHSAPSITLRYIGIRDEDKDESMKNFYL